VAGNPEVTQIGTSGSGTDKSALLLCIAWAKAHSKDSNAPAIKSGEDAHAPK
jgi:hypothetical protein